MPNYYIEHIFKLKFIFFTNKAVTKEDLFDRGYTYNYHVVGRERGTLFRFRRRINSLIMGKLVVESEKVKG